MSVRLMSLRMLVSQVRTAVAHAVPVVEHPAVVAAEEPAAEDGVGLAVEDRLDDAGDLGRVVLEIGVLDDGDVAGHVPDRRLDRGALAHVALVEDGPDRGSCAASSRRISAEPSRRAVVDAHQLHRDRRRAREHAPTIVRRVRRSL